MMPLHLIFRPEDHPAHLKKVGNWVITFPANLESDETSHLVIQSVIPQQMNQKIQLLSLEICQSTLDHHWEILIMRYFDGEQAIELHPDTESLIAIKMLKELIQEFRKYDVELQLK
ncbi:hypothetical protein C3F34_00970 [Acinetobacter sp. ACNIH2]|uniref:hypothetical protein n=1 Tax=Acinetobacter sp. ACNIH2 TaxID=1758189 RepID=UPI000CDCCA4E|nr:hypothetical protein [Acinetobacter sp. ACNIH2]AUX84780.1 hypothetical protein C3F34_00970 [Acinetobacter sp. ACNIH2]